MFDGQGNQHTHIMYTHIGAMRMFFFTSLCTETTPLVEGVNTEAARVELQYPSHINSNMYILPLTLYKHRGPIVMMNKYIPRQMEKHVLQHTSKRYLPPVSRKL